MNKEELMKKFREVLEDGAQAILATVTSEGYPAMRYMTPAMVRGNESAFVCRDSGQFSKGRRFGREPASQLDVDQFQVSGDLFLSGKISLIEDPRFKSELLEEIGRGLETFWRLNDDPSDLVCLETKLVSGEYFNPKTAEKFQIVM